MAQQKRQSRQWSKPLPPPPMPLTSPRPRRVSGSSGASDLMITFAAIIVALGAVMGATSYTKLERKRIQLMVATLVNEVQSPNVTIRAIGNTIVLEGYAFTAEEKHRAVALANAYSKSSPILGLYRPPTDVLDFVEVNKPVRGQASYR